MAPTIIGGIAAPKIVWAGGTLNLQYPQKFEPKFKEEAIEHSLVDKVINKKFKGYRYEIELQWNFLNDGSDDDIADLCEVLNYLEIDDDNTVDFYPHSDNDFYVPVICMADIEMPLGIGEKNKLSGHSFKIKFSSKNLLTSLPFGWVSPVDHNDPDSAWTDEYKIYDDNTSNHAYNQISASSWGNFIELEFHAFINFNKIKITVFAGGDDLNTIDIDYHNGTSWVNLVQTNITAGLNKFDHSLINSNKLRVRFYNNEAGKSTYSYFKELDVGLF